MVICSTAYAKTYAGMITPVRTIALMSNVKSCEETRSKGNAMRLGTYGWNVGLHINGHNGEGSAIHGARGNGSSGDVGLE